MRKITIAVLSIVTLAGLCFGNVMGQVNYITGSEFDISCPKKVELMRVNFRNLIYFGQQ